MAVVAPPILVTSLQELCIRVAASNFESSPHFGKLADRHVKKIIDILPLDLPLELIGTQINDEDYWKRRCHARWKNMEVEAHAGSFKQLYFERNLQDAMEQYDPAITSEADLRRCLAYSRRYVQSLNLTQLPSHMDLSIIFECMANVPTTLRVQYNLQSVGMEYDRALFGMKLTDCRNLAKVLETTETLTYLDLSNNMLDDDKVRMLASGLVENLSVTHLNLSHNKVADRGVRALAKLLDQRSVVAILELHDNLIHTEGAKSLARALKNNQALISLNLRLNRMGDDGVKVLCEALKANCNIEKLNLAANSAGKAAATAVSNFIRLNNSLTELDVSCNSGFGPDGCEQLRRAVEVNSSLLHMDMRVCGAEMDDEFQVAETIRQRLEKRERAAMRG